MDYQAAWDIVTGEWAFLPNEDRPPRRSFAASKLRNQNLKPATSG